MRASDGFGVVRCEDDSLVPTNRPCCLCRRDRLFAEMDVSSDGKVEFFEFVGYMVGNGFALTETAGPKKARRHQPATQCLHCCPFIT